MLDSANQSCMVMFTAYRHEYMAPVSSPTVIPFTNVTLNIGAAYNNGTFTAPVDGYYWFAATLYVGGYHTYIRMVKNNFEIASTTSRFSSANLGIHLYLDQGDRVWMELTDFISTGRIYCYAGQGYCIFTGSLIQVA